MPRVSEIIRSRVLQKQADIWDILRHRGDPGMLRRQQKRHYRSKHTKSVEMGAGGPEVIRGAKIGPPPGPADKAARAAKATGAARSTATSTARGATRSASMANPVIKIENIMPSGKTPKPQKSFRKFVGKGALTVGGIAAVGGAMAGLSKAYDALTFKKDYEDMLDFAPEIKDYDEKAVKARFQTLRRFNPEMSRDPLVASSWIKQTIEYPVVTPATLKDVIRRDKGIGPQDIAKMIPRMEATEPF